jgi:hypothetical protein
VVIGPLKVAIEPISLHRDVGEVVGVMAPAIDTARHIAAINLDTPVWQRLVIQLC